MDTKSSVIQSVKTAKDQNTIVEKSNATSNNITQRPPKPSRLPWVITYNRKKAALLFKHARSKEHGLKHIDIRKGMLALFWIGTFITVMTILIIMVVDLCKRFASNPVATQIKAEQDGILFPDISVCAKAPFHVNAKPNQTDPTKDLLDHLSEQITQKLKDSSIKLTKESTEASLLIQMATRQETQNLRAYQHIIYCEYDQKDCSFFNFTEFVHLRYLQCFTFSPNAKIISGGRGLQFIYYKGHGEDKPFMMLNDLEDEAFQTEVYDGIHVLVHNPETFPTYKISSMPTSFSLRFGQQAHIEVSGLNYRSDMSGRKSCIVRADDYKYTNFRGGANYLEYRYTFEDCVANMKQRWIRQQCDCFSDDLFVPFQSAEEEQLRREEYSSAIQFCRDIRGKTSQVIREQFLCHEQYDKMPTTTVLDQFIDADKLFNTREDLDARKILRHQVCSLPCEKQIYLTKFFEITDMDPKDGFPASILSTYIEQLRESRLQNEELQKVWDQFQGGSEKKLLYNNTILIEIRAAAERIDAWEEELTESLFNLISNLGGTLGLCAGISFLSSFFLLIFFGRAFVHALVSLVLWFWWAVYLAKPPTPDRDIEKHPNTSTSDATISMSSSHFSPASGSKASKFASHESKPNEYQHTVEKTGDSFEPETKVNIERVEALNSVPQAIHKLPPPSQPTAHSEVAPVSRVNKHTEQEIGTVIVKPKPAKKRSSSTKAPPQRESVLESQRPAPELIKVPSFEQIGEAMKTKMQPILKRIPPILKISRSSTPSKSEDETKDNEEDEEKGEGAGEEEKEEEEEEEEEEEKEEVEEKGEEEEKEEESEREARDEEESLISGELRDEEEDEMKEEGGKDQNGDQAEEDENGDAASENSEESNDTAASENGEKNAQEDDETESTTTALSEEEPNNDAKKTPRNSIEWVKAPRSSETSSKDMRLDREIGWPRQSFPGATKDNTKVQPSPVRKSNGQNLMTSSDQTTSVQPSLMRRSNAQHRTSSDQTTPFIETKPQRKSKPPENIRADRGQGRKPRRESFESNKDPFGVAPLRRSSISYPFEEESVGSQETNLPDDDQVQFPNMRPHPVIPIPPKLRTYNNSKNQKIYAFEDDETLSPPLRTLVDQKLVPGYIESLYMRSNPYSVPRH